jgi:hypothetical protein
MRSATVILALVGALLLAACGGSGGDGDSRADESATSRGAPPAGSLEALWRAPGEDVAIIPGTSDHAPGQNRVSFLVVDKQSRLIEAPTARVWVARGLAQAPFLRTTARTERIGVPGGDVADVSGLYVANINLPRPGRYWLLAEPVGGSKRIQAIGNVIVQAKSLAPSVGERAISTPSPTLASTGGDLERLTTSTHPDRALYRTSVSEALDRNVPFVVTFATPLFCQTRACGPVVDVVSAVRKRFIGSTVRFIHVEIYKGNDPAKGTNRWVDDWKLPKEPFTFVVDGRGVVRAKLEGAFSARELSAAVRTVL